MGEPITKVVLQTHVRRASLQTYRRAIQRRAGRSRLSAIRSRGEAACSFWVLTQRRAGTPNGKVRDSIHICSPSGAGKSTYGMLEQMHVCFCDASFDSLSIGNGNLPQPKNNHKCNNNYLVSVRSHAAAVDMMNGWCLLTCRILVVISCGQAS